MQLGKQKLYVLLFWTFAFHFCICTLFQLKKKKNNCEFEYVIIYLILLIMMITNTSVKKIDLLIVLFSINLIHVTRSFIEPLRNTMYIFSYFEIKVMLGYRS